MTVKKKGKAGDAKKSKKGSLLKLFNDRKLIAGALAAMLIVSAGGWWLWQDHKENQDEGANYSKLTDGCEAAGNVTFSCYRQMLESIVDEKTPAAAFGLLKKQYDKVPYVKSQCHQLVHVIGRAAYLKYGDVSGTFSRGDNYCWSGYFHGAIEELIRQKGYDYVVKNANDVCEPIAAEKPQSFYHYNCVHGLGHGFMFVRDGELFESLTACDSIRDQWERVSCYGGVFMQNIMNVQGPDADPTVSPKHLRENEPMYPCTGVEDKYKQQCYLMQTSYALQTVGYDFSKVFRFCSQVESAYRSTCYRSLGRDASGSSISDVESTSSTCKLGQDEEAQMHCLLGAASDFVSYFHDDQKALQLCAKFTGNIAAECTNSVRSYYSSFN